MTATVVSFCSSISSFVIAVQKKDKEQHVRFTSSANNSEEEQLLKQDK